MIDAPLNDSTIKLPTVTDLSAQVRAFITTNFYVADVTTLRDDASLLDTGVIDSTGVLEVISFLERDIGIEVGDAEIVPENLDSIARITAYIQRKRG